MTDRPRPPVGRQNVSGRDRLQAKAHLGSISAETTILAAWSAIGVATALDHGDYYVPSLVLVSLGTLLLVAITALRTGPPDQLGEQLDWGLPIGAVVFTALVLPVGIYGALGLYPSDFQLNLSHTLTAIAALVLAFVFLFVRRASRLAAFLVIGLIVWAGVATILASPSPQVDVWYLLQAAAHGLSHGANMYNLHWFAPPGEDSNAFPYLPGSAVLVWPFYLVFGDVRYGDLAALALTAVMVQRARGGRTGWLLACLVLLYPGVLFSVEQAWVDPLVILEVCAAAYACTRGRKFLAVLAFAAALVTKQQAWLLIPLAAVWEQFGWRRTTWAVAGATAFLLPWYIGAPAGFVHGALLYNLRLPALPDSLSLFATALLHGRHPAFALVAIITIAAIVVALWRGTRDTRGFLIGSAMVEAVFDLVNKLSHFNEWELAAGLALLALGFSPVQPSPIPQPSNRLGSQSDALAPTVIEVNAQTQTLVNEANLPGAT